MKKLFLICALLAAPATAQTLDQYVASCNGGNDEACLEAAKIAQARGDTTTLFRVSERGCALNNVISCSDLGMLHVVGIGGKVDIAKGRPLIQQGCKDGYSRACANMGWMIYTGKGFKKDPALAATYYKRGCDGRSGPACANLALMYDMGDGVARDPARASRLRTRACDLGNAASC